MKALFFLLFFIFLFPLVSAIGFSPANLVYMVEQRQELCQDIRVESSSETLIIYDIWAESSEDEWEYTSFETFAEDHGLTVSYPTELSSEERTVEVCISGSELGEYHGAVIIQEQQIGNSISQVVVWLKVVVEEHVPEQETLQQDISSSSSRSHTTKPNVTSTPETPATQDFEPLAAKPTEQQTSDEPTQDTPSQVENTVGKNFFSFFRIIPIVFIAFIVIASIYVKRRRRNLYKPAEFNQTFY